MKSKKNINKSKKRISKSKSKSKSKFKSRSKSKSRSKTKLKSILKKKVHKRKSNKILSEHQQIEFLKPMSKNKLKELADIGASDELMKVLSHDFTEGLNLE